MNPDETSSLFRAFFQRLTLVGFAALIADLPTYGQVAPPVSSSATAAEGGETVQLKAFTVSSEKDKGYGTSHAIGAARLNTLVIDTPMTVVTLNEQFLKDTGFVDWVEAAKYISGVNLASSSGRTGQISLRGYNAPNFVNYRDGLNDPGFDARGQAGFDPATVERLEVIKGAAGVLYGSHTLGGLVNRVSKLPRERARSELTASVGNHDFKRLELDTERKLAHGFSYRVVAVWQDAEVEWGGPDDRVVLNPSLRYRTGNLDFWTRFGYEKLTYAAQASSWFTDSAFNFSSFMPRGSNLDEINEAPSDRRLWAYEVGARSAFTFGGIRGAAQLVARHNELSYTDAITDKTSFTFVDAAGNPLRNSANQVRTTRNTTFADGFAAPGFYDIRVARQVRTQADDNSASSLNFDVTGEFELGPTKHKALTYFSGGRGKNSGTIVVWDVPATFALRPTPAANPISQRTNPRPNTSSSGSTSPFSWAWGITDQVSFFNDRAIVAAGARYDDIASISHNRLNNTAATSELTNWTYRYGIVLKPHRGVSLFANHSETFQGGTGAIDSFGNRSPQTIDGVSEEAGVKLDLLEGRFVFTGSYFDMTLKPFTTLEFIPGTSDRILVDRGANRTRGYEIDLAWQAARGLTLIAGYGDLTSRSNTGSRFRHVAEGPNYKLFAKYEFSSGVPKGLSIGGGYSMTPSRAGDAGDTFSLPEYWTIDGFIAYRRGKTAYRLSAINLTDRYLPVVSINRDRITTIDPRAVRASISYEF